MAYAFVYALCRCSCCSFHKCKHTACSEPHIVFSCDRDLQYVGLFVVAVQTYLCSVSFGSGRLPDRVQTTSPSGCGLPCTGPLETHTPAAAPSSRSTPSCPHLWLYILYADATGEAQRHTQSEISFWCIFYSFVHVHLSTHICLQPSTDGHWVALAAAGGSLAFPHSGFTWQGRTFVLHIGKSSFGNRATGSYVYL